MRRREVIGSFALLLIVENCRAGFNMVQTAQLVVSCEDALYDNYCDFKRLAKRDCLGARDFFVNLRSTSCTESEPTAQRIFQGIRYARFFRKRCSDIGFPADGCSTSRCSDIVFIRSSRRLRCTEAARSAAEECYAEEVANGCSFAATLSTSVLEIARNEVCSGGGSGTLPPGTKTVPLSCRQA
ncbi:uncharacterized protein [Watersipora subatra]|uniref:uncharacterized protein n=1 Tax=Watersipora subatra TaxID=2589382 RepID=UPI00355C5002